MTQETFNALKGLESEPKPERGFFKKWPPVLVFIFDVIKLVIIAFIIVWPIHRFIFQPFYVVGPSMEPNFYDKDYLIIEKISYHFGRPQRGEVVIFRPSFDPKDYLIKRVVGLPGERIVISKGEIHIYNDSFPQGFLLTSSGYLLPGVGTPGEIDLILSKEEYYFLGDNRNMSLDSRSFGPIKEEDIVGRAWFRGWPFETMGLIKTPSFAY